MFLNFFHLVMQQQSLWGNIGFYSDGFRPKPGPRPGARLLEIFQLQYLVKFQGMSRPRARHSVKGSSPDPVHTFRAQPITRYLPTKVHSYMYYKKVP